jgi:hypothetical protein
MGSGAMLKDHDHQIAALRTLLAAYKDMRKRLSKVDRDLERFHGRITRLAMRIAVGKRRG